MAKGRPRAVLSMSEDERSQLMSFARSRSLPSTLSADVTPIAEDQFYVGVDTRKHRLRHLSRR